MGERKEPIKVRDMMLSNIEKIYCFLWDIEERLETEDPTSVTLGPVSSHISCFPRLASADVAESREDWREYAIRYLKDLKIIQCAGINRTVNPFDRYFEGIELRILDISRFKKIQKEVEAAYKAKVAEKRQQLAQGAAVDSDSDATSKAKPYYRITFDGNGIVWINNIVQVIKTHYDGTNDRVFHYLYQHPNQMISIDKLNKETGLQIHNLHKVVNKLGFTKDLKKIFFDVSKDSIRFRNPITKETVDSLQVSPIRVYLTQ